MAHYAVINNGETHCNRVVTNKREDLHIIDKNYIKIHNEDHSFVGRIYDFDKEEWTDEWYTLPEPPLTDSEQAILETAANTEYLVCLAELNMY